MYTNYENRVKNFIFDMINPDNKIIIKDISKKIETSRGKLMSENPSNKKPFIFRGYKSEKDRIKEYLQKNSYLHNIEDYTINEFKNENISNITPKKSQVLSLSPISKNNLNISPSQSLINESSIKNNSLIHNYSFNINTQNKDKEIEKININSYNSLSPIKKGVRRLPLKEQKLINFHIKNDIIMQPQMKFTPRTDLERIYDNLIEKYSRINEKMIIERQIKSIDKLNFKTPKDLIKEKYNYNDIKNESKEMNNEKSENKEIKSQKIDSNKISLKKKNKSGIFNLNKYFYNPKNNYSYQKLLTRKKNLNAEAVEMLKSYHYKIHFKAAEEIAENKIKNKHIKNKYLFLLPNLFKEKSSPKIKNIYFEDDENNSEENEEKYSEENYDSHYYKNPLKKLNNFNPDLVKEISKLAFKKLKKESENSKKNNKKANEKEYNKKINLVPNLNEENEIRIDGKIYNKINQFDLIANKILKLCKVYNNKSIHNNNNLKARSGKTMITQGMPIKKFEQKYKLNK